MGALAAGRSVLDWLGVKEGRKDTSDSVGKGASFWLILFGVLDML